MSVFLLCEQAIGLVRGKRLILTNSEKQLLEGLNYEGLTAAHAQDEAVVCALHFARVRDRLLQLYPWVFARKSATVSSGGALPDDLLTILAVFVDGKPAEWRQISAQNCEIRYTGRIVNVNEWDAAFTDVFVYSLAVEICNAVTGKPDTAQLLEQKAQELLHRARQTGAIKSETKVTLKQEIFNRAIGLSRGQRIVDPTSEPAVQQGIDNAGTINWRQEAEVNACMRAYEGVRDRLLSGHSWIFARKTATVEAGGALPEDCLHVLCVLINDVPIDYEISGGRLNTAERAEVHYTAKIIDMELWDANFSEAFVYSLGAEICLATTANTDIATLLEEKAQELISRAYQTGAIKSETRIPIKEELYYRAVLLSRGQRTLKESGTAALTQGTDNAGLLNDRMTAEYQVCKHSGVSVRNRLFEAYPWQFARKSAALTENTESAEGWKYGYKLPDNCAKVLAIIGDNKALEFERIGSAVYCNEQAGTVRYTGIIEDAEEWAGSYRDLYTYQLAVEVVYATSGNAEIIQLLEQKSNQVIQFCYNSGVIQPETQLPPSEELFGRAISIAHGAEDKNEDLTSRNARELSVCRRSADYIRDRLLQAHKWKFARKKITAISGAPMPEDMLSAAGAFIDGNPAEIYEIPQGTEYELHYTARISDIAKWDALFKDAFCYLLAGEIIRAVKGNAELAVSTESKADEFVRQGYTSGIIEAETKLPLKDEIFNRAITLARGQRITAPSSENSHAVGLDYTGLSNWRIEAEYQACSRVANSLRDRLLELHPWVFARKSRNIEASEQTITGWEHGFDLPEDCLTVLTVLSDDENIEPLDYEISGKQVFCNASRIILRYTASIREQKKWPSSFVDAFVYLLACEVLTATMIAGEALQGLIVMFTQKSNDAISQAYKIGLIRAETNILLKDELCSRAIGLLKGLEADSGQMLPATQEQAYSAIRRGYNDIRDTLLQLHSWNFARKTCYPPIKVSKVRGWRYTFLLPPECLRVNNVLSPDTRLTGIECINVSETAENVEILDYEISGNELYTNRDIVFVRYTERITKPDEMPPVFREALICRLAKEAAMNVNVKPEIHQLLAAKEQEIIQTAQDIGLIRKETRLPIQHDSRRTGFLNRQYLDYSGLITIPCGCGECKGRETEWHR